MFLKILQNSQENTCTRVFFLIKLQAWDLQLFKNETLAQVFSCEFRETFDDEGDELMMNWIDFVVWLTDKRLLALFPAGTIVRNPRESLTLGE